MTIALTHLCGGVGEQPFGLLSRATTTKMTAVIPMAMDENLLCDEAVRDPYQYFQRLREHDPVHWNPRHKAWVVTRHGDLSRSLRGQNLTAERITPFAAAISKASDSTAVDSTFAILKDWVVFRDPPEHTRLRTLVARAFAPSVVRRRLDEISDTITELSAALPVDHTVDLINEFAFPLPAIVIAQMLGVPPEDRDLFKDWSDKLTALVFGAYGHEDRFHSAAVGMLELRDYLLDLIEHYERCPGDNLISVLLEHEGDDSLTRDELVSTCTLLLFGGHETTTNLIGNGMLALLSNPDQLQLLRANPQLIAPAVEEMLRFDGPARATVRLVKDEHQLDDKTLRPGERVFLINPAGNRDPEVFVNPDQFDITRHPTNHLGLGVGIHYCLGAPLARLEGQLAISALLRNFPDIELAVTRDELDWHPTMLSRGLKSLPVRLHR
jgi:cytochrome P450